MYRALMSNFLMMNILSFSRSSNIYWAQGFGGGMKMWIRQGLCPQGARGHVNTQQNRLRSAETELCRALGTWGDRLHEQNASMDSCVQFVWSDCWKRAQTVPRWREGMKHPKQKFCLGQGPAELSILSEGVSSVPCGWNLECDGAGGRGRC